MNDLSEGIAMEIVASDGSKLTLPTLPFVEVIYEYKYGYKKFLAQKGLPAQCRDIKAFMKETRRASNSNKGSPKNRLV